MALGKLSDKNAEVQQVPEPQSPAAAGFIQAFSGNVAPQGWLLLNPAADTTITDAENQYPDLWANTNPAWRSGSDLIIPASVHSEGNWQGYSPTILGNGSGLNSFNVQYSRYKANANTMVITGLIEDISVPDASVTVISWSLPTGFSMPTGARNTVPTWAFDEPDYVCGWGDANGAVNTQALNFRPASGNWSNTSDFRFTIEFEINDNDRATSIIKLYDDKASVAVSDVTATETMEGNIALNSNFFPTLSVPGLMERKMRFTRRVLPGDVTADGTIQSLAFDNLVIGRWYLINLAMASNPQGNDNVAMTVYDGNDDYILGTQSGSNNGAGNVPNFATTRMRFFQAATTDLRTDAGSLTSPSRIVGNGTLSGTFIEVLEIGNIEENNDFVP